jgi:preprotein translocase subunit SecD
VLERRVNFFGVAEPLIQVEQVGLLKTAGSREQRLVIELPGVTDVNQAIKMIGETPFLEFRIENPNASTTETDPQKAFLTTDLTGRYLQKATLEFNQTTYEPTVLLQFNDEGGKIFAQMTKENINKRIAIFLDGAPISIPKVNEEIPNGKAQITGQFTADEAKTLVQRLNSGALPLPISLISQENIGPTLGEKVLTSGVRAGVYGLILVALFLILWYRVPGIIAVLALMIYTTIMLALFKIIPVTLTAAGIAGLILSIGMAVDANILIFERMKEELRAGKTRVVAMELGFGRAWDSIRDANICTIITCFVLFNPFNWSFLNSSGMVRGFASTLFLGVVLSLFTGILVTRTLIRTFYRKEKVKK